jgi:hypothetical protein
MTINPAQLDHLGLRAGDLVLVDLVDNQLVVWKAPEDALRPPMLRRGPDTPPADAENG